MVKSKATDVKYMEWIKTIIPTTSEGIDIVCDKLSDIGIKDVQIEDEEEFNIFLHENKKYWDYVDEALLDEKRGETKVIVYIKNDDTAGEILNNIKNLAQNLKKTDEENILGRLEIETDGINEEDWANNWKEFFKPIEIGKKLLIQPEWETYKGDSDRIIFTVNPGLTFGTGTHNSTKLCICELEDYVDESKSVLDIGCGSGILSIISLLLGAKYATALDIDPNAVHVAYENAERNNVDTEKYKVYAGDILSDCELFDKINTCKYDVIVANIVADVIIALLPIVKKLIAENGTFICSGIINERLSDVADAMQKEDINIDHTRTDGEWSSVVCKF